MSFKEEAKKNFPEWPIYDKNEINGNSKKNLQDFKKLNIV